VNRSRAEELLSDYREGALDPILRGELDAYLQTDEECRRLLAALDLVADAMPTLPRAEPGADLAPRVAAASWRGGWRSGAVPFRARLAGSFQVPLPAILQAAAAVLLVITGVAGLIAGPEAGPSRAASRIVERAGVELREGKDRIVESLKLLQVVVGTAFESRIDRMGDRVEDFRQLLEERRVREQGPSEGNRGGVPGGALAARAESPAARTVESEPAAVGVRITSRPLTGERRRERLEAPDDMEARRRS